MDYRGIAERQPRYRQARAGVPRSMGGDAAGYTMKSLRRSTKLLLKYFSRTTWFSASSSGVP